MRSIVAAGVFVLVFAACGDPGGGGDDDDDDGPTDAPVVDSAVTDTAIDGVDIDSGPCPNGTADHPTFWPTICDAANMCGWLVGGHVELDFDEASCNTRHASDPDPSTQLAYMNGFETRIHAAASCLGCQRLVDAYFRPDLETVWCGHIVRCGFLTEPACLAGYRQAAMMPGSDAKFDYACPRYCMEALAVDAACSNVVSCLMACN